MNIKNRGCGVLLHITSLPGPYGIGEIGKEALAFIDVLDEMGQKYWQFLPTNYPAQYNSPYDTDSAFAQNPLLLSIDSLIQDGLLSHHDIKKVPEFPVEKVDYNAVKKWKKPILNKAVNNFLIQNNHKNDVQFKKFVKKNNFWLDKYAIYLVIQELQRNTNWFEWDKKYKNPTEATLDEVSDKNKSKIESVKVLQYLYYKQWSVIREYSVKKNIRLIGDVPIYVSYNSADVWANQKLFRLNLDGSMKYQSGCPPDLWSETGQVWGHPTYDWDVHEKTNFTWWLERIKNLMEFVDIIRIDHFNGFAKYWEVSAKDSDGLNGKWLKGKGEQLLNVAFKKLKGLNLIAEDLGEAWREAAVLRKRYEIPGMHLLQFAFHKDNPFDMMEENMVAYTGTHDNDTLSGFYETIDKPTSKYLEEALIGENSSKQLSDCSNDDINWLMIEYCLRSNAYMAIIQAQDILCLGKEARVNTPATISEKNWAWRIDISKLTNDKIIKMRKIVKRTGRL